MRVIYTIFALKYFTHQQYIYMYIEDTANPEWHIVLYLQPHG